MTNISAKINYNNQTIDVSVSSETIPIGTLTGYRATAVNSDGLLIGTSENLVAKSMIGIPVSDDGSLNFSNIAYGQIPFGTVGGSNGSGQVNGTLLGNCDLLHTAGGFVGDNIYSSLKTPFLQDKINAPVLVTSGDSVFFGQISSVSTKRLVTYTGYSGNLSTAQSIDFAGDLLYIFSGSGQGTYATITATGTTSKFYVDKDFTNYVSGYFKILPRRNITGNSTWSSTNVRSELYLDESLYSGLSCDIIYPIVVNYISGGSASGYPYLVNPTMKELTSYGGMELSFTKPSGWGKDEVKVGDIIKYRSYDTPSLLDQTAVVYHIGSGASSSTNYVYVYPSGVLSNLEGYTDALLVRSNQYKIMNYPKFEEEIMLLIHSTTTPYAVATIKAPSAKIYLNANDYDSAFGTVTDRSHFHIGPVILSNGEVLTNHEMILSGSLYNSDPTQTSPDKTWVTKTTQDSSAAEYMSGEYFKNGILVGVHNQSFISSEMLTVRVKASYGTAEVENSITIPVQPSA